MDETMGQQLPRPQAAPGASSPVTEEPRSQGGTFREYASTARAHELELLRGQTHGLQQNALTAPYRRARVSTAARQGPGNPPPRPAALAARRLRASRCPPPAHLRRASHPTPPLPQIQVISPVSGRLCDYDLPTYRNERDMALVRDVAVVWRTLDPAHQEAAAHKVRQGGGQAGRQAGRLSWVFGTPA